MDKLERENYELKIKVLELEKENLKIQNKNNCADGRHNYIDEKPKCISKETWYCDGLYEYKSVCSRCGKVLKYIL